MRDVQELREKLDALREEREYLHRFLREIHLAKEKGAEISAQVLYEYGKALARIENIDREISELESRLVWG